MIILLYLSNLFSLTSGIITFGISLISVLTTLGASLLIFFTSFLGIFLLVEVVFFF